MGHQRPPASPLTFGLRKQPSDLVLGLLLLEIHTSYPVQDRLFLSKRDIRTLLRCGSWLAYDLLLSARLR